jgi:hypothetical protein
MRKRTLYVLACLLSGGLLAVIGSVSAAAAGAPGSLDPSFGNGGKVLTDLGAGAGGGQRRGPAVQRRHRGQRRLRPGALPA